MYGGRLGLRITTRFRNGASFGYCIYKQSGVVSEDLIRMEHLRLGGGSDLGFGGLRSNMACMLHGDHNPCHCHDNHDIRGSKSNTQ